MHQQRDPYTSYRVEVMWPSDSELLTFSVTIFPPSIQGDSLTVNTIYREDVIPEWVRTSVDMLNMAAIKGEAIIPHFGNKSGTVYWLFAQQTYEKEL